MITAPLFDRQIDGAAGLGSRACVTKAEPPARLAEATPVSSRSLGTHEHARTLHEKICGSKTCAFQLSF